MNAEYINKYTDPETKAAFKLKLRTESPSDYDELGTLVAKCVGLELGYCSGRRDYDGSMLFVFHRNETYYAVLASYGSCSYCDALEHACGNPDELWTLGLHLLQGMRKITANWDDAEEY